MFSARDQVERILAFEAALARALAKAGVISVQVSTAIEAHCDVSSFDISDIEQSAATAGNVAIPVVERLRQLVEQDDADAAAYVHWGATSQDAMDSALMLQLREALASCDHELSRMTVALADLATTYAATPMAGRTLMQHAAPTTFGCKAATWLDAILRHRARLAEMEQGVCVLQFGGAVGTLAALGADGPRVADLLAEELGLERPALAWHSTRDRVAEVATTLALVAGTLGKIARDISLMSQSEIDEVRERPAAGRGRSSTMPHKRNPVGCAAVLSAAVRAPHLAATVLSAMVQEHERGLGGWQAEWSALPELVTVVHSALEQLAGVLSDLEVRPDRMLTNLEATNGLIFAEAVSFALTRRIGRPQGKLILERAIRSTEETGAHLKDALLADGELREHYSEAEIIDLFEARNYLGVAEESAKALAARARKGVGTATTSGDR